MKFSSVSLVDKVEDNKCNDAGIFFFIKYLKVFFCSILFWLLFSVCCLYHFCLHYHFNVCHEFVWILQFILYFKKSYFPYESIISGNLLNWN